MLSHSAVWSAVGQFLRVENLEPRKEAFPHNFTVCISTMFEFSNVLQVRPAAGFPLAAFRNADVWKRLPVFPCSWCRALKC